MWLFVCSVTWLTRRTPLEYINNLYTLLCWQTSIEYLILELCIHILVLCWSSGVSTGNTNVLKKKTVFFKGNT